MATNDRRTTHSNRGGQRTRKRDKIVEGVTSRPYTAAAVATLAGAAGAAAYFLTRSKEDRPLMKWGQESDADSTGTGAASPSARQADKLAGSDTSTSASAAGGTRATAPSGGVKATSSKTPVGGSSDSSSTGLDETVADQTKVGSVAYGA